MSEIYEKTSVKKLGLTPEDIRNQCMGGAFDGKYFSLNAPEALAKMMIERAKVTTKNKKENSRLARVALVHVGSSSSPGTCHQR